MPKPPWRFDPGPPDDGDLIEAERTPSPQGEAFDLRNPEEIKSHQLDNQEKEDNLRARTEYAEKAYHLVWAWTGCIVVITLIQFIAKSSGNALHHSSFIALVVSTSGLMFGFWALVGRYLFPQQSKKKD